MYRSLHDIIQPLNQARVTGRLTIYHGVDELAEMHLNDGKIGRLTVGKHEGAMAAKSLAKWVCVAHQFEPGQLKTDLPYTTVDMNQLLQHLKKIKGMLPTFRKFLGGNSAIFKFIPIGDGEIAFAPDELKISFLMDGQNTIETVIQKSGLPELDVLLTISRFYKKGLVQKIQDHQTLPSEERQVLIGFLRETLSDITGPVARELISDALVQMSDPQELLSKDEILLLLRMVAANLNDTERAHFLARFQGGESR
jgi:hypothetical protein